MKECFEAIQSPDLSQESYRNVFDSILLYIQGNKHPPELNDVIEALQQTVSSLFDENECMKKEIDQLKEKLDKLQHLEALEADIVAGQIASKLERQFVSRILKGTDIKEDNMTINQLHHVVGSPRYKNNYKEQLEKINQNWDILAEEHKDLFDLFGIIEIFKTERNSAAHPKISLEDASKYLSESSFNTDYKQKLNRLIEVLMCFEVKQIGTYV